MSELRVLAGEFKGKKLKTLPGNQVRPMLSRFKKSLFDILNPRIAGAHFLDLYAGSGSVGIEALSRGAEFACFVESDRRCQEIILDNLKKMDLLPRAAVILGNVESALKRINKKFDLIFAGPPYINANKEPIFLVEVILKTIEQANVLKPGGWIIIQCQAKENVPQQRQKFALSRQKEYGDTRIYFYRYLKGGCDDSK
ncbi:MAG: 16S rRNA (guanine(966)-N(2))-methyltransferase RsmD [Elusimicrobiota bacterium]